jgi:hypothetical protein
MGSAIRHQRKSTRRLWSLSSEILSHADFLWKPRKLELLSFIEAYRDLHPPLEWPDFLGNGLFVVFCTWVLYRALLSPEGFWVLLLVLLVLAVGLVQLVFAHCRLAWRARFSRRTGR